MTSMKCTVTLSARVWIEMAVLATNLAVIKVTLSARVWIEILTPAGVFLWRQRHPQCEGVD